MCVSTNVCEVKLQSSQRERWTEAESAVWYAYMCLPLYPRREIYCQRCLWATNSYCSDCWIDRADVQSGDLWALLGDKACWVPLKSCCLTWRSLHSLELISVISLSALCRDCTRACVSIPCLDNSAPTPICQISMNLCRRHAPPAGFTWAVFKQNYCHYCCLEKGFSLAEGLIFLNQVIKVLWMSQKSTIFKKKSQT